LENFRKEIQLWYTHYRSGSSFDEKMLEAAGAMPIPVSRADITADREERQFDAFAKWRLQLKCSIVRP